MRTDSLDLEYLKQAFARKLSRHQLGRLTIDVAIDHATDSVVCAFSRHMPTETLAESTHTVSVRTPATWWEHFKRDVFPDWLLSHFPPRYEVRSETVTFKQRQAYPRLHEFLPPDHDGLHGSFRTITKHVDAGR